MVLKSHYITTLHISEKNHVESHNTLHHSKYVQRNPVQFVVTQLTISCPDQNKTGEYIVRKHAFK